MTAQRVRPSDHPPELFEIRPHDRIRRPVAVRRRGLRAVAVIEGEHVQRDPLTRLIVLLDSFRVPQVRLPELDTGEDPELRVLVTATVDP